MTFSVLRLGRIWCGFATRISNFNHGRIVRWLYIVGSKSLAVYSKVSSQRDDRSSLPGWETYYCSQCPVESITSPRESTFLTANSIPAIKCIDPLTLSLPPFLSISSCDLQSHSYAKSSVSMHCAESIHVSCEQKYYRMPNYNRHLVLSESFDV